jgi:hypothetical protein
VFFSVSSNQGWDGKYKHQMQQSNVFVWLVEGIDEKGSLVRRKGTVALIR